MLYQQRQLADGELRLNEGLSLFSNISRPALLLSGYCHAHEKNNGCGWRHSAAVV
jgi:hypothetical protein